MGNAFCTNSYHVIINASAVTRWPCASHSTELPKRWVWAITLKTQLIYIIFKKSVHTSRKAQHFTIIKMRLLTLLKKIIPVCTENHTKIINTECSILLLPLALQSIMDLGFLHDPRPDILITWFLRMQHYSLLKYMVPIPVAARSKA
jgi:hypothetical protein